MDNSNNNGLEYDDNSDMSDKKPHRKGFRNGFGVGIATGIVTTIVLGLIVLFAYTMITGRSVHTVAKSADVLDDKTVQKIDELANYIDEYYYEDYDKDDLENGLLHGVMEGLMILIRFIIPQMSIRNCKSARQALIMVSGLR